MGQGNINPRKGRSAAVAGMNGHAAGEWDRVCNAQVSTLNWTL